mgnify:CR=1 FL=1|jgi:hypothetical protein
MTEEEKKKQAGVVPTINQKQLDNGVKEQDRQQQGEKKPLPTGTTQKAPAETITRQTIIDNISKEREQANNYRKFAQSPVIVDKSGQRDYLQEFINSRADRPETPEEKAAREKREKSNRSLAALTDGLVALSNVAGAMAGATPAKPTSMSAVVNKAAKEAAERRRLNARQYEIARQYYSALQQKQDAANAKEAAEQRKLRDNAAKQADKLEMDASKKEQGLYKNDRNYDLAKERNHISASKKGTKSSGSGRSGSSGSGSKGRYTLNIGGVIHHYNSAEDYKRAVQRYAIDYGVATDSKSRIGDIKPIRTEKIAANVEREANSNRGSALRNRNKGGSALRNRK